MTSTFNGKTYTSEARLFNDFSELHPEIHGDDIQDAMDFGGEVEDIEDIEADREKFLYCDK